MRIAVLVSGNGSNLQAIIAAVAARKIKAAVGLVVSDNLRARALTRARRAGIKTVCLEAKDFSDRESYDRALIKCLHDEKIDCVILAGFMRILSSGFVKQYKGKLLNIHPSLLPAFKGAQAIKDAFDYGVKVTGVTVHFVDEKVDHGPIVSQKEVIVRPNDTLKSLAARIHAVEHEIYPAAIGLLVEKKLAIRGRKVIRR